MNTEEFTFSDLAAMFRRQFKTMAYIACPLLAAFVGVALGWPAAYQSTGVIRIDQRLARDNRAIDTYAEYYVQTLSAQVFTGNNIRQWIDDYGLYAEESSWGFPAKAREVRANLRTSIITTPVLDPISGRERDIVTGFDVSYRSRSPAEAQQVASAASDAFLAVNRRTRQARGQSEIDFFRQEVETYRTQIAEVEARLAEFKERNNRRLPELVQINMNAMDRVESDLESTQLQIDTLKRERVILQSELNQIPTTSDAAIEQLVSLQNEYVRLTSIYQDTHPNLISIRRQIDTLSNTVDTAAAIPILRQQQEETARALAETRRTYSDDHPDVRALIRSESALEERIAALSAQGQSAGARPDVASTNDLYVQLDTQVKAIDTQILGLTDRVDNLRQRRDEYQTLLLETPQVERESQELLRDLANARQLYEETQEQQRQAELGLALQQSESSEQLVLVQAPGVPQSPAWPPRLPLILLGTILALGLGVGIATIREVTTSAVRGSRDTLEICGAPPIAIVPTMRNRATRVIRRIEASGFLAGVAATGALAYVAALRL